MDFNFKMLGRIQKSSKSQCQEQQYDKVKNHNAKKFRKNTENKNTALRSVI